MTTQSYPIGIIGGTHVDAQMGIHYFKEQGLQPVGIGISHTPEEATTLQVLHPFKLQRLVVKEVLRMKKEQQVNTICIYCNSLSAAIRVEEVEEETKLPIVTPLDVYRKTAGQFQKVGLLAANCQSLRGIERIIHESNESAQVVGTALLQLVIHIETGALPTVIFKEQGLLPLLRFFETVGVSSLILGCTHFPYLQDVLAAHTSLPIIDPAEEMLRLILSH